MTLVRLVARPMISWVFVSGGMDVLANPEPRAEIAGPLLDKVQRAVPFLPDDRVTLVRANALVQVVAGVLFAKGRLARLWALLLAASLVPTTLGGHPFWTFDDPVQRGQHRAHFMKNVATLGGLLLAVVDTEGRPSLSWRARRAARRLPRP
jgi:putative oxidoreductase